MSNNPFDPFDSKNSLLAALGGNLSPYTNPPQPSPHSARSLASLVEALGGDQSKSFGSGVANPGFGSNLGNTAFGSLFAPFGVAPPAPRPSSLPASRPLNALEAAIAPPHSALSLYRSGLPTAPPTRPAAAPATIKRKAFFSFYYNDIMRVNVVRNAWKIDHPDNALMRSFYDSSLWESRKLTGDAAVKKLIREGVTYTSAVCVLVGSETWLRRWVKYEIARAIIDGKGLLAVHLNSIRHHKTLTPHTRGENPLKYMAIGKVQEHPWYNAKYYLFEKVAVPNGVAGYKWEWRRYADYTDPVSLPKWVTDPVASYVTPLADCAAEYDYIAQDGSKNIGAWIDQAAKQAGR